jgi:inner membrane protein involved in colicin E2 resistance
MTYFHSKLTPFSLYRFYDRQRALNRAAKYGDEGMLIALVLMTRYCASSKTKPTAHMMQRLYVACLCRC